ncbi:gluconate 2-dehydrogenase subunit 3 family protein [Variovorax arabinosiphilus]|uniref:gluconate 2-dehydrogenase subunit 3 family protein n=1 Tax=Variovorax arabinosiphilus TaxID=3053498 RepID=UPI002576E779|nr:MULTISPECIES: gluconate 2-dehydrogenase subunit 3 family protein [unclassified Variovorax]MDM0119389.1 gluconate 2-dehydrogenase subunit 3 family protein [Variovorax sp. J2L1-78]MDM0129815.1 gluconate 2-dehydrogenase subunit 3 family protein [Variovorax sp. J2L1-63]MDM0232399.1 gluconate 2-dehydrogenase subunit 3 family protein [Variovorax sp. J2R1-6]
MTDVPSPGRRGFLRRSIAIVPAAGALTATGFVAGQQVAAQAASAPAAAASPPYTPVYFHAEEWAFIQAAVARLIPSDDTGPGAIEAGVPEFIDRQMEGAFGQAATWYMQGPFVPSSPLFGYQGKMLPREVYRAGIAATDAWCKQQKGGKRFAELDTGTQDEVLKGLDGGTIQFAEVGAKDFFTFLLQNTKEGYFSDPIHGGNKNAVAWKMIGFPGARADFLDWVDKPGVHYPLPPVSINGPQG